MRSVILPRFFRVFCAFRGQKTSEENETTEHTEDTEKDTERVSKVRALLDSNDLLEPPAKAHKEEAIILEKFGRFSFEVMPDELEDPSDDEKSEGGHPEVRDEEANRDH